MTGGQNCIKYLLFIFNLIFVISGLALIVVGSVAKAKFESYVTFVNDRAVGIPILVIAVGVIIFLIAFLGCFGAIREQHCMVLTFSVLLAIIFIVEISAAIAAYFMRDSLHNEISNKMNKTIETYDVDGHDGATKVWDFVQTSLECCGPRSYDDWRNTNFSLSNNGSVPDSCCLNYTLGCGMGVANKNENQASKIIHTNGCLSSLQEQIQSNVAVVAGTGVAFAVIQILGVGLACFLAHSIRKGYEAV